MNYKFPHINTIADVMEAFDPNFFYIADKGDYKIINYMVNSPDTFPHNGDNISAIRPEFRGITFDKDGNIIRRTMQKFFNVEEKEHTQLANIDISAPHSILSKIDGSMISPFLANNKLIWGTKLGDTEIAQQVEA